MRKILAALVGLPVGLVVGNGCFFSYTCVDDKTCPPPPGVDAGDAGDESDGPTLGCDPINAAVSDTCGVFVSPMGDDKNPGTKEKPLATLSAAVAKGTTIYACAGSMPFNEPVSLSKPTTIFGALDCTSWAYNASKKTALTAPADAVPLTLASTADGSAVHDFTITAADATKAGGSSIGVLDDGAGLALTNVELAAGAGKDGVAGAAQAPATTPMAANGQNGSDDAACNIPGPIAGAAGGKNMCGMTDASGGVGGNGIAGSTGGDGQAGQPMTPANAGSGQTKTASCNPGGKGQDGTVGMASAGARGIGDLTPTGYQGSIGVEGGAGTPGQGGGGGGGAFACDMPVNLFAGPSGGGGGAGGCGGAAGNLGQSGGSSIGLVALGAKLTLTNVTITTSKGGGGGLGGDGQLGGAGGQPGGASGNACGGGKGGQGGPGGPGGGGAGGHSIGVAVKGGMTPDVTSTTFTLGGPGLGGAGGDMDATTQTKGDDGLACRTLDFVAGSKSCAP